VPLIDFHAEILKRRPNDWDGKLPQFAEFSIWEVPTLIAKDGVHLSNPKKWKGDFSDEGLKHNGCVLRNYVTMMAYAEVIEKVLKADGPKARPDEKKLIDPPMQKWFPKAPPLPKPTGQVVRVRNVGEFYAAANRVKPGGTIRIADGHYMMTHTWYIRKNDVTIRSESGDRTKVVLDFARSRHGEGLAVSNCTGVTIADLTVQNVSQNGIKINSNTGAEKVTIYNVISHNVWQRHIKGVKVPDKEGKPDFVHGCRVQYCLFYNDRPKRHGDDPWEDGNKGKPMGYNYIGGMDVMNAKGWVISDNVFTGIHGKTGECRGGIFMWHNSTDVLIERNIFIDCDTGIALGNSSARGERRHCNNFTVRNNFITRCPESNILADHTRDCKIINNTVCDPTSRLGRLIRVIHANDGLVVANNIFCGPSVAIERYEGKIDVRNNLVKVVPDYFVNAAKGDLHLTAKAVEAIDKATPDAAVAEDFDRTKRTGKPDLGADEFVPKKE
jgi:hypothetical protein